MNANASHTPAVGQLLSIVRASLWQTPADSTPFAGGAADWDEIGRLAMLQTVGPLAAEGAMTLPPHLLPPKEWLRKGYAMVQRNRHTHRLLDSCVAEAFTTLTAAGLHPVLLKGQAYARAYPDPTLRQCGDIDIYVGPEDYRAAFEAARRAGWESKDVFIPEAKHYGCSLRGVKIELHRAACQLASDTADRRFAEWSHARLAPGRQSVTIGGAAIDIPAPMFDVIFVFLHLYHHFLTGGIGLRHLCDWTMLLHSRARDIDRQELKRLLKHFQLLKAWRLFAPIAVECLGLPPQECPLYSPRYGGKAAMILEFIVREGNFGHGRKAPSRRPKEYVTRKAYSFMRYSSQLYSKFRIAPAAIMSHHLCFMHRGMMQVIRDISKRRRP